MRAVLLSIVLTITACAHTSGSRPINVHAVRVEIADTIESSPGEHGPRSIVSMGKVTADSAVVYTDSSTGRHEETWQKGDGGWTLRESRSVAAAR